MVPVTGIDVAVVFVVDVFLFEGLEYQSGWRSPLISIWSLSRVKERSLGSETRF